MNPRKILLDTVVKDLEKTLDQGVVTPQELIRAVEAMVTLIRRTKEEVEQGIITAHKDSTQRLNTALSQLTATESRLKALIDGVQTDLFTDISEARDRFTREIARVEGLIPSLPDLTYLERMIQEVRTLIPTVPAPLSSQQVKDMLLEEGLGIEDIEGLNEALQKAKEVEIRPGGGGGRGFFLYVDGVKKGILNTINFKSGSNMSISHSKINGLDTLTFTSSGGGGGSVTIETPPESVNASRTAFTVTAEPKYMVADGTTYFAGAGYTYGALTVTFDIAPSQYVRAII